MPYVEVRKSPLQHQSGDGFVVKLRHASASGAHHLHSVGLFLCDLVFIDGATLLPLQHVEYMCVFEQFQRVIDRSLGDAFAPADFFQLFCGKGLRQLANLVQHDLTHSGHAHLVRVQIGVQRIQRSLVRTIYLGRGHLTGA